jgi:hypothetical protein
LAAPAAVIVTIPLYAPATTPVVFTDTFTLPGAVPPAGLTESHWPPEAVAVKLSDAPAIAMLCAAGAEPPVWYAKLSEAGLTVSVGAAAVTLKVTGTVFGLPVEPAAVIVTEPL